MNNYIIAIIGALIATGVCNILIRMAQEKRRKEQQMLLEPGQIIWNGDYNEVHYVMCDHSVVITPAVPLQILHFNGESIDPIEAIIENHPTCSIKDVVYMILSIKEESPLKVQALLYQVYGYVLTLQHKDLLEDGTMKFEAYEDGILQEESTYKDGYLDGPFKSYYPNGNLMEEGMYKNGVPHGLIRTYYENGQIANESNVINGQFSGLVKSYYPSGKLKHKSFSKNHQPDGEDIFYYENGQIAIKGIYSEGVPLSFTAFDKNGNELTSKKEITRLLLYFVSLEKVQ